MDNINNSIKQIFDKLPGTVFLTNEKSEVLYANNALSKKTGFEPAEIIGKRPGDLWGGRMDKTFYTHMWAVLKGKKEPFMSQLVNVHKNGDTFREEVQMAPIFNKAMEAEYFIEVQPVIKPVDKKNKFQEEFGRLLGEQKRQGTNVIDWMLKWLNYGNNDVTTNFENIIKGSPKSLSEFFSTALVAPNILKYGDRQKDKDLVASAKFDPDKFQSLYLKYWHEIHYYFLRRVGYNGDVSSELAQETFLRAFQHLPSFVVSNASYRTYLLRISHNLLVNYFRKDQTVSLDQVPESFFSTADNMENILLTESMWRAVEELSRVEQEVLKMKYKLDLSIRDISLILNKSENAVKLILSRGRKKLKDLI